MDLSLLPEIRVFSPFDPSDLATFDEIQVDAQGPDDDGSKAEMDESSSSTKSVPWDRTFDMRVVNLSNFPANSSAHKVNYRTHNSLMTRAKSSVISSPVKSLNSLRAVLQKSINKDLDLVVQSYLDKFFKPAIANLKKNTGDSNCISDHQLQSVCRTMLDEAKKLYFAGELTANQRGHLFNSIIYNPQRNINIGNVGSPSQPSSRKRHRIDHSENEIESGNESSNHTIASISSPSAPYEVKKKPTKKKLKTSPSSHSSKLFGKGGGTGHRVRQINPADGVDRSGPRWDPERLSTETTFVLGSKANKALGFGALRGRLYTKHPNLFRYIGDQEDKVWLSERGLMPPAGGRAYLLVKDDIEELIESQYQDVPGVSKKAMGVGILVPQFMIDKMKKLMSDLRSVPVDKDSSVKSVSVNDEGLDASS